MVAFAVWPRQEAGAENAERERTRRRREMHNRAYLSAWVGTRSTASLISPSTSLSGDGRRENGNRRVPIAVLDEWIAPRGYVGRGGTRPYTPTRAVDSPTARSNERRSLSDLSPTSDRRGAGTAGAVPERAAELPGLSDALSAPLLGRPAPYHRRSLREARVSPIRTGVYG